MISFEKAFGLINQSVALPGWLLLVAAVIGAAFVFLLMTRSEHRDNPITLLVMIGMLVGGLAVGAGILKELRVAATVAEATALDSRAAALDSASAQSGLGCLAADESLAAACEAVVFERPDTVAAARGLVGARLALVEDAFEFVRRRDAAYLMDRITAWRRPLERDPFGLVAAMLADTAGCTDAYCPQLAVIGNSEKIATNLRDGRLQELIGKYAPIWERVARNRGTIGQPVRTGPFGLPVVERPSGAERPPAANLPVEEPPAAPPAPAAEPRPAPPRPAPAPAPAAQRPAPTTAAPRPVPRPRPVPPPAAPATDPAAADDAAAQ